MGNIKERLDNLRDLIQEPDFLEGKGLSNEVNIRIFCYEASDEMVIRHFMNQIKTDQSLNCHVIEYDLFQTLLAICDDKRITKSIPRMEEKKGKDYLLTQMHSIVTESAFIDKMQYSPHEKGDVLLLTGIGEVFPFMRVHILLEAMQAHFSDIPILVMYPGMFDGHHLKLFDKLQPNDYYRAFNVI